MKRFIKGSVTLSVLVALILTGGAHGLYAADAVTPGQGMFASLGLTDDQKAQLKGIFQQYRPTLRPLASQYFAAKRQLRKLIHATPVDEAAIRAQVATVSSIGADFAVQRANLIQAIGGILTPAQIQQLAQTDDDIVGAKIDRSLFRFTRLGK